MRKLVGKLLAALRRRRPIDPYFGPSSPVVRNRPALSRRTKFFYRDLASASLI